MVPTPSATYILRKVETSTSSTSSSSSSLDCDGKDKNLQSCQKPTNETALEVGLGVGIPVGVILLVLSFFLYRNWRKDKKEALEHDPDFDENGDATALPDFPAFTKEDPFAPRNSVNPFAQNGGYPMMLPNRSGDLRLMLTSDDARDSYVDGFMLPYHHQTGSKALLDEYAKQIIDPSTTHHRRGLTMSQRFSGVGSARQSPQKSALRQNVLAGRVSPSPYYESADSSESNRGFDVEYENEPSDEIHPELKLRAPRRASHSSDESFKYTEKFNQEQPTVPKFHVESPFEDRPLQDTSELTVLTELPELAKRADIQSASSDQTAASGQMPEKEHTTAEDHERFNNDTNNDNNNNSRGAGGADTTSGPNNTHDDSAKAANGENNGFESHPEMLAGITTAATVAAVADTTKPTERGDGDFDFSTGSADDSIRRSPRMSAFNMMQNVSDDEDEAKMTPDQAEELARIKSVYKVYFDRANSVKSTGGAAPAFQPDHTQPLPLLDVDRLRINNELSGDTRYDKRLTSTSSIYEDHAQDADRIITHPHQQFNAPPPNHFQNQYYAPPPQQQYQQQPYLPQQQQYQEQGDGETTAPLPDLPPLKSLPTASDIRHSTIETFTDYQPRAKIQSPSMRNQHGYFEDASSSPYMGSQVSFGVLPDEGLPPTLSKADALAKPSPSQLARKSVVMMNPVTEITTLRKFKPAGSLPVGVAPTSYYQGADELSNSNDDLIPNNRKSAVRRMMNTNF